MVLLQNTLRTCLARASTTVANGSRATTLRIVTTTTTTTRSFGSRGSRGHGWYTKYRAGDGDRHLQGEYHDRDTLEQCQQWNESVLALGSTRVFMDVVVEPKKAPSAPVGTTDGDESGDAAFHPGIFNVPPLDSLTKMDAVKRLEFDMATAVMPETCHNFATLCDEYKGTILYRFEKNVGLSGGDILTNTGKTGRSHLPNMLKINVKQDPLVLWHLPGTVSMLVSSVEEIDSRFFFCTTHSPHLDGIQRAFGQLTPESLKTVQEWQGSILTRGGGFPTTYDMIVVDAGVLSSSSSEASSSSSSPTTESNEQVASASA